MRIRGHVLEVKTTGDKLEVKLQGEALADAAWRPMNVVTFQCADLPAHQKAFHVGRKLSITIEAE
jgi:hypothetical protein